MKGSRTSGLNTSFFYFLGIILFSHFTVGGEPNAQAGSSSRDWNPAEAVKAYDAMESALIARLEQQKQAQAISTEIAGTIDALGHIRSTKSVKVLLEMLELHRSTVVMPNGLQIKVTSGPTMTTDGAYPALGALQKIGVPIDLCIEEIQKAKGESLRERLLTRLARQCHGRAFTDRVHDLAANSASVNEKWTRILKAAQDRSRDMTQ